MPAPRLNYDTSSKFCSRNPPPGALNGPDWLKRAKVVYQEKPKMFLGQIGP